MPKMVTVYETFEEDGKIVTNRHEKYPIDAREAVERDPGRYSYRPPRTPDSEVARPDADDIFDNLKAIKGIGPGIEKRLNGMGITTYLQLSELDDDGIAEVVAAGKETAGEVTDWIAQAKELLSA